MRSSFSLLYVSPRERQIRCCFDKCTGYCYSGDGDVASLRRRAAEAQDALVHGKHDGGAGDRPQQMRCQAAVETHHALLLPDQLEALDEAGVLELAVGHGRLAHARAGDLVRVRQDGGHKLGDAGGAKLARPLD